MYSNGSVQFIHSRPTDLHFSSVQFADQCGHPIGIRVQKKNEAQLPSPLAETPGLGFASSDQLADTSVSAWKASHASLGGYYAVGPNGNTLSERRSF